jgi:hypothetical protein
MGGGCKSCGGRRRSASQASSSSQTAVASSPRSNVRVTNYRRRRLLRFQQKQLSKAPAKEDVTVVPPTDTSSEIS